MIAMYLPAVYITFHFELIYLLFTFRLRLILYGFLSAVGFGMTFFVKFETYGGFVYAVPPLGHFTPFFLFTFTFNPN